jgi:DNA-binding CsgD family transcriptional regulator
VARWNFVGRVDEKHRLVAAATGQTGRGLIFSGAAGIGKSRLLRESLDAVSSIDFALHAASANIASSGLPFGGLAQILPADPPSGLSPAGLMRWAVDGLRTAAAGRPIVLAVDDVHLLDPPSAALLHLLVHEGATMLGTLRSGEPVPSPISALWTAGLVDHAELSPLSSAESNDLLTGMLGGPVESATAVRLARLSDGNPLLLRELVMAARGGDEMVRAFGLWRWTGRLSLAPTLTDLVDHRIGNLPAGIRDVVDLVAFGEPIGLVPLMATATPVDVEAAEDRGLIRVVADDRRLDVRLAHPLYGEIVRRRCPVIRTRRLLATLAELIEGTGARRRDDLLRVAVWRLDSGTAQDSAMLLDAAGQAFGRFDMGLAQRLGEAARRAGGGYPAVELLATILMFCDQPDRALELLDDTAAEATSTPQLRGRWLTVRAMIRFSGLGDPAAVDELAGATGDVSDPGALARMRACESLMRLQRGEWDAAVALANGVVAEPAAGVADRAMAQCVLAFVAAARGKLVRCEELLAEVDARTAQWRRDSPAVQYVLEMARGTRVGIALDLDGMDAILAAEFADLAQLGEFRFGSGYASMIRAHAAWLRGRTGDALRASEQACAALGSTRLYDGCAHVSRAQAAALRGETDIAVAALQVADSRPDACLRHLYPWREQVRAWVLAAAGDLPAAVRQLQSLTARLFGDGLSGNELLAQHELVRLGRADLAVGRMAELVRAGVQGPTAHLLLRHARASADGSGAELLAVAHDFAGRGLHVFAAEAGAAAVSRLRAERDPAAVAASTLLADVLSRCDTLRTPMLMAVQPVLTPRERQVAELAAVGVRSREIADRLFLSTRTVENHLQRVYAKLGVSGRMELDPALRSLPR